MRDIPLGALVPRLLLTLSFLFLCRPLFMLSSPHSVVARSPTIDIVVSICNETDDTFSFLRGNADKLQRFYDVTLVFYCKCMPRDQCISYLPNIGRESHTFLWHTVARYHNLSDVTIFVNGGLLSKNHVSQGLKKIVDDLLNFEQTRALVDLRSIYADQYFASWNPGLLPKHREDFDLHGCLSAVSEFCESSASCNIGDFWFCEQQCGCDSPKECRWAGLSTENRAFSDVYLPQAVDVIVGGLNETLVHNIYSWACSRFYLTPYAIDHCGYTHGAVFAVGSLRLRTYSKSTFTKVVNEFALYGPTGGLAGHYMERLYRSVFHCAVASELAE